MQWRRNFFAKPIKKRLGGNARALSVLMVVCYCFVNFV